MPGKDVVAQPGSHSNDNRWADLSGRVQQPLEPAAAELVAGFQRVYANGRAEFASFLLGPAATVAEITRPPAPAANGFWRRLLLLPAVAEALEAPAAAAAWLEGTTFSPLPAAALAADLAETLAVGGAYRSQALPRATAEELAESFAASWGEGQAPQLILRKSLQPWSGWFMSAPWDRTWLGLDRVQNLFWVLRATDTD